MSSEWLMSIHRHRKQHHHNRCSHEERAVMKAMTIGLITMIITGNIALLAEDQVNFGWEGQLSLFQMFIVSAISAFMGVLISIAAFDPKNPRDIAMQSIGNFGLSVSFSPLTAWAITRVCPVPLQLNIILMVPVAVVWGIGGIFLLKKVGPKLLDMISNRSLTEGQKWIDPTFKDETKDMK